VFFILKIALPILNYSHTFDGVSNISSSLTNWGFDYTVKIGTETACNETFEKESWSQAFLPI